MSGGRFAPVVTELTEPFWDATREGTFLVQWCDACTEPVFHPREVCPLCLRADSLAWRPSSGAGTVYAVSVQHRAGNPLMADRVPYVVVLVELDAGDGTKTIRLMSNVIDCDPLEVRVGDRVRLAWEALEDGRNLPQFAPP